MRKEKTMFVRSTIAAAALLAASSLSMAQSADFVLIGDSAPESKVAPEQKFVHPLTTPYYHEDSFVTSDVRAWFVHHDFPSAGVIDGGYARDYAVQLRLAITPQLQLVAYKDGYLDFDAGLLDDAGYNDIAAGLKWNFLQDWENQMHAAVGVGYELPLGDPGILQNDDEIRAWASFNKGFDKLHLGGTVNVLFPVGDEDALGDSTRLIWNLHADYYVNEWFSPVIEASGFHVLDRGEEVVPFSGVDVLDLGGGGDVITLGFGAEVRPMDNLAVRCAYELPLTDDDNDLYGWRITASVVYSF